jgi:hypothetical protein
MGQYINFLKKDRNFLTLSAGAVVLNVFSWMLAFVFFKKDAINIILHYNILSGVDYQGGWRELFTVPAIGLAIIFMNFTIVRFVCAKDKFIPYFLVFATLISQIFIIIAIAAIILINHKNLY